MLSRIVRALAAPAFVFILATPTFAKSLYWRAIDVDARLDADGNLHVVERQQMVFDGDWNGGERTFNIRRGQTLNIHRVVRVENGREIPLMHADLSEVDHWDTTRSNVVRWRSRLPSDPPFANRELTYLVDYTLSRILLVGDDKHYTLDHDFGMPLRSGAVQQFRLNLAFDPVWGEPAPIVITRADLPPGEMVIVKRDLTYHGNGNPTGVDRPIAWWMPLAALTFFGIGVYLLYQRFLAAEQTVGRFAPLTAQFDEVLLSLPAEVAGAAWDEGVGAPEVAAVIARMAQEGKLTTRTDGSTLHLHLNARRDALTGYEHDLVSALFYDGRNDTNTDAIRTHYASTGFNPTTLIYKGVQAQLDRLTDWNVKRKRFSIWLDLLLFAPAGLFLLGTVAVYEGDGAVFGGAMVATFFSLIACGAALYYSKVITNVSSAITAPMLLYGFGAVPFVIACAGAKREGLHGPTLFALACWLLVCLNLVFHTLRIRETVAKIAYRKRIAGARQFFIEQLQLPNPAMRDEWFPYVLAFGLGDHVDRWFRAFNADSHSSSSTFSTSSSSSSFSSSSSSPSWTGGGGAFGGAGASGSWALAAGAMAAGVSAPSSSGSSGGGGGGGSSSGGGGGGGW